jgi:hypothetical protein
MQLKETSINVSHRKERHFKSSVMCLTGGGDDIKPVITVRIYETASAAYMCVWVSFGGVHTCASAKSQGYGYIRANDAIVSAANQMGFRLTEGPAVDRQVRFMAQQLGLSDNKFTVITAHG